MSWVSFNFPDESEVRVSGSERASFGIMIENHAKAALGLVYGIGGWSRLREVLTPFVNPEGPLAKLVQRPEERDDRFDKELGYHLHTMGFRSGSTLFAWKGVEIGTRQLILNTVLATGSDAMRLAVKIHFQCEIHGYVMGYHRKWLADIVEEGLEEGVFRQGMKWTDLIVKLREANQGPVVTSSSSSDPFPNRDVAVGWMQPWPEGVEHTWTALTKEQQRERSKRQEEWETLEFDKQWALSVKGLKVPGRNRPWAPDTLRAYRFGHDLSLLDLYHNNIERIEKGLKIA